MPDKALPSGAWNGRSRGADPRDDRPSDRPGDKPHRGRKELPPGLEAARAEVLRTGGITTEGGIFDPIEPPATVPIEDPVKRDYDSGDVIA